MLWRKIERNANKSRVAPLSTNCCHLPKFSSSKKVLVEIFITVTDTCFSNMKATVIFDKIGIFQTAYKATICSHSIWRQLLTDDISGSLTRAFNTTKLSHTLYTEKKE